MKSVLVITVLLLVVSLEAFNCEQQQQQQQQQVGAKILRRVIKSTPTASNLARVRLVTVRSSGAQPERGAVSEISSKEAANFGQRSSSNETNLAAASQQQASVKSAKPPTTSTTSTSTTTSSTTPATTTTTTTSSTTSAPQANPVRASERQQAGPQPESVELLSSAPSSWQMMTAVDAPAAAALIAAGTRPAVARDLASSSSEESSLSSSNEVLRSSATKGSFAQSNTIGETFSRLRQGKTAQQQQQSFFYPQQQRVQQQSKTSNYQAATKAHWYQPSTTTTQRPAPIIRQQQYEQQNEQYVEQQQQVVEAAPPGLAEPFAFDFNTLDNSGNGQYRKEESDRNGVVRGSYGYTDANGIYRHVEYVADHNGFRANIKSNEPGLIGETQPANIRLDGGQAPAVAASQRFSAGQTDSSSSGGEWAATSASGGDERADLAQASPEFESSHKAERIIRAPRNFRN